jgi:hypothetical protein
LNVTIYVEGGGDGPATIAACRRGFLEFFAKLLPGKQRVNVRPFGGRKQTYDAFVLSLKDRNNELHTILLVDAEEPVAPDSTCWEHLRTRRGDGWTRPPGVDEKDVHLMVQTVESWFLADPDKLAEYYGQGFKPDKLPAPVNGKDVECHRKIKIYKSLNSAIKATKHKKYKKSDGFELVGLISPKKVCKVSVHAQDLAERLDKLLNTKRN